MTTGVFFHESFRGKEWLIIGDKFRNFPKAMGHVLKLPQVKWFAPKKVSEDLLLKIHTSRFVQDLKKAWYCEGRYLVLTHGGERADVAEYIFPRIVEILAQE